ncbi:MAG TPA: AgmX/PglI C-terminal domain-containing protein [Kofleriaceae bacterium]|nr:AgmX/PglI C-terminal domain-containing protein [Kofleriaceae bacterium]
MTTALRTALIWHDEVMNDVVLDKPRAVTLGARGRSTFVVPEIGLPPRFAIVRPGKRGYLLTLGERMRGTICVGGQQRDVAELVKTEASGGGFCATPIRGGDWGVIDLDPSGQYKVFFQFVSIDEPPQFFTTPVLIAGGVGFALSGVALTLLWYLKGVEIDEAAFRGFGLSALAMLVGGIAWSMVRQDTESQASLAFSVILHAALLFMTYQLYDGQNPFVWPGPRSLTGNYLVTRLDKEEPPEPKPVPTVSGKTQQAAAAAATKEPPKNTATKGAEGRAGGKGEKERARDPNARDVPPEPPKVQFFEDKNKKVLDNIIDRNLSTSLSKFTGLKGDTLTRGSMGFGPGTGTGVGPGEGTGTRTGSKRGGSGGGGNVEGDFVTGPGKIDTGGNRPGGGNCKGGGCGTGPKAVQVGFAEPAGDFGGLTAEEIDRVVKARAGVFRACYQKELNHTPGIGGKLVIHFKIGGDGTVQAGNTSTAGGSTLRNDGVESCVKSNVNRLKFPAKGGIANVNYPFVFTQGG